MHRCPAAPNAAPTIEFNAKFLLASGIKMQWSVDDLMRQLVIQVTA